MAITKLNTYTSGGNFTYAEIFNTLNELFKSNQNISINYYDNVEIKVHPASVFGVNGNLYEFIDKNLISTTDPYTSIEVADGLVYIMSDSSGIYFTATAPTWNTSLCGFYGSGSYTGSRYLPYTMVKTGFNYTFHKNTLKYQNSKIIYTAEDVTERTVTSTSFVVEPNLSLSIPYVSGEIWDIYFRGNFEESAFYIKTVLGYSIVNNSTSPNFYVPLAPDISLPEHPVRCTGKEYAAQNILLPCILSEGATGTATLIMTWRLDGDGSGLCKDRKFYAIKRNESYTI